MLDELFAKLDTPLRVALVSHMARSRMLGDSEGKRGFSELVKEWTRKCLGKKTSAESEAITLECHEKVEALETRLAHQRMLEAKVKVSAEEYDANMWHDMKKVFMVLVLAACYCSKFAVTPDSGVTEDDRLQVQALAADWAETALALGQYAVSVGRTSSDIVAAAGKTATVAVKTVGGAAVLNAGWVAVQTVSSLIETAKRCHDGPIIEPRDPMEQISENISNDVQSVRAQKLRHNQMIARERYGEEKVRGIAQINDNVKGLRERIKQGHVLYDEQKISQKEMQIDEREELIKVEKAKLESELKISPQQENMRNLELTEQLYELDTETEQIKTFRAHRAAVKYDKMLQRRREDIIQKRVAYIKSYERKGVYGHDNMGREVFRDQIANHGGATQMKEMTVNHLENMLEKHLDGSVEDSDIFYEKQLMEENSRLGIYGEH
jgi:hypothetical protein